MGKRTRLLLAFLLGGLAVGALLLSDRTERRPNVIVVLSDSLRRDHLGCYGYARNTSEHIDAFAADALVYERAYAQAPSTKPSVASLFTSTHASRHGVIDNQDALSQDFTTLGEVLSAAGYATAGFLETPTVGREETGYSQGFSTWWLEPRPTREERNGAFASFDARVRGWIDTHRDQEFFLYVHYVDPHSPYDPLPPYEGIFADVDAPLVPEPLRAGQRIMLGHMDYTYSAEGVLHYLDRYDEEIRVIDDRFQDLIAHLEARNLLDRSLVIFLSDHGEAFGEHGYLHHSSSVYAEQIDIPLIVRYPRSRAFRQRFPAIEPTGRISTPTQHVDLFPTVLDAIGLASEDEQLAGRSLLADPGDEEPTIVSEHLRAGWGPARVRALVRGPWKLVHDLEADRFELFDLEEDWQDLVDVRSKVSDDEIAELEHILRSWSAGPGPGPDRMELDTDTLKELRALGYVE
jgi:arylsulfatase A-like enzyme